MELHEGNAGVFRASVRKRVPHYFKDERCALVFEVVYTSERVGSGRPALRDYDDYGDWQDDDSDDSDDYNEGYDAGYEAGKAAAASN